MRFLLQSLQTNTSLLTAEFWFPVRPNLALKNAFKNHQVCLAGAVKINCHISMMKEILRVLSGSLWTSLR